MSSSLDDGVTKEQIAHANDALVYFVGCLEYLYEKESTSFNMHLLLHVSDIASNWGPFWEHSAFLFEDYNGHLQ